MVIGRSIEVLELDDQEIDRFVGHWLDTLPPGERAAMNSLWRKRPEQRDLTELENYERQREERDSGGNGGG